MVVFFVCVCLFRMIKLYMFLGCDNEGIGLFVFILREIEKGEYLIKD